MFPHVTDTSLLMCSHSMDTHAVTCLHATTLHLLICVHMLHGHNTTQTHTHTLYGHTICTLQYRDIHACVPHTTQIIRCTYPHTTHRKHIHTLMYNRHTCISHAHTGWTDTQHTVHKQTCLAGYTSMSYTTQVHRPRMHGHRHAGRHSVTTHIRAHSVLQTRTDRLCLLRVIHSGEGSKSLEGPHLWLSQWGMHRDWVLRALLTLHPFFLLGSRDTHL